MVSSHLKTILDYLSEQKKKSREFKSDLSNVPFIHYKTIKLEDNEDMLSEGDDLPHERLPDLAWRDQNDNAHLGNSSQKITKELEKKSPKLSKADKRDVEDYTGKTKGLGGSGPINTNLLNKKRSVHHSIYNKIRRLHKIVSSPIGHDVNLYSGVYSDPRRWEKGADGSTRLRAFTSMTHDKRTAHVFAHQWAEGENRSPSGKKGQVHIIHLHAKASDRGLHVEKHSPFPEHETVLPPDTYIKPHPDYPKPTIHTASDGTRVHVHHYVIHSQHPGDGTYRPENPIW